MRGALALLAALFGYHGTTFSLAQVFAKVNLERAYKLAPYDGRITARLSAQLSGLDATASDRRRSDELAKSAVRQDATAVAAVSALGVNAQMRGDIARARRLFAHAGMLSRRDMVTQLWAIEDAVTRGDVKDALQHYDIALRVKPQLSELLFPVLAKAGVEPAIRVELTRTLVARPAWGYSFVMHAAANSSDPLATVAFLTALRNAGVAVPEAAHSGTVNALIANDLFDQAWAYYRDIRPGVDRRRLRDTRFSAKIEAPTQFDWSLINDHGTTAVIEGGVFDFSAPGGVGGAMLLQVQLLPPGTYRLSGHSEGVEQLENARPYWVLSCRGGRELGRVVIPNSTHGKDNFAGILTVPGDCPVQTLVFVARASEEMSGLSGRINRVELIRIR